MSTPHIAATPGQFAPTVLMPGDPLRARHIAETMLDDALEITSVRAMCGFTGTWKGQRVSVMGSGMGIPSASIYATELIREYGVKRIVRIGTCGAVAESLGLGDLVLAAGACTDSGVNRTRFGGMDFSAIADFDLLHCIAAQAKTEQQRLSIGNVFSADLFYSPDTRLVDTLTRMNVLGIEMEAAGLYGLAAEFGAQAVAVLAVSDHLRRAESWPSSQRQLGLDAMVRLVLDGLLSGGFLASPQES